MPHSYFYIFRTVVQFLKLFIIFLDYGLEEENLSKDEMSDILKALKNSKSSNTGQKQEKVIFLFVKFPKKFL